jgi:hypothetical protein
MSIPLAHFTTYLGSLVDTPLNGRPMKLQGLRIDPLISKDILAKYEAAITFCSYMSRLIYENRARKVLKAYKLLDYSPLVFNTGLSHLTYSKSTDDKIERGDVREKPLSGFLLYDAKQDTPVSVVMFDYTKEPSSIFGSEKIIVVCFRGTLSVQTALKDLYAIYGSLFTLFGNDLFSEEAAEVEKRKEPGNQSIKSAVIAASAGAVNPFGAHRGFVNGLENILHPIVEKLKILLTLHPDVSRIFVVGQSLGGAYAHLFGLFLAQLKKKNGSVQGYPSIQLPKLHVISFGAPKCFTDYSRNVFNGLLLGGFMTLDRVTNRPRFPDPSMLTYDPIPLVPQNLDHPGFMILKLEIKTQSRTGRTKHIAELRDELAGIQAKKSLFTSLTSRNYNPLPDYPEFYKLFKDSSSLTVEEYASLLSTSVFGTVRGGTKSASKILAVVQNVLHVSAADMAATDAEATEQRKLEVASLEKTTVPSVLAKEEAETANLVKSGYTAAGENKPTEGGGLFPTFGYKKIPNPPVAMAMAAPVAMAAPMPVAMPMPMPTPVPVASNSNSNTAKYKKQTVKEQPNHLVYSCSQVTTPIPIVGCHLGYMGVSYSGALGNVGSGTITFSRDYKTEAALFYSNGEWTYLPNSDSKIVPISNAPVGPNFPKAAVGGKYSRKQRRSKRRFTSKRRVIQR